MVKQKQAKARVAQIGQIFLQDAELKGRSPKNFHRVRQRSQ